MRLLVFDEVQNEADGGGNGGSGGGGGSSCCGGGHGGGAELNGATPIGFIVFIQPQGKSIPNV